MADRKAPPLPADLKPLPQGAGWLQKIVNALGGDSPSSQVMGVGTSVGPGHIPLDDELGYLRKVVLSFIREGRDAPAHLAPIFDQASDLGISRKIDALKAGKNGPDRLRAQVQGLADYFAPK